MIFLPLLQMHLRTVEPENQTDDTMSDIQLRTFTGNEITQISEIDLQCPTN